MRPRILAVIVLYQNAPEASISYISLLRARQAYVEQSSANAACDLAVLIYDNTPTGENHADFPEGVTYFAAARNAGLASAYNYALKQAIENGCEWLLTLDQDTHLPSDMFLILSGLLQEIREHPEVAALVPRIIAGQRQVSPYYFAAGAIPRQIERTSSPVSSHAVFAFNSGSLLRVTALRQINGYFPLFWLDNSDLFLYRSLQKHGKRIYVVAQLTLEHDFSMFDMSGKISAERYHSMLLSESAFWDMHMSTLAGLERTGRLIGRWFKHFRQKDSAKLRSLTREAILSRLFRSRADRIEAWRRDTRARLGEEIDAVSTQARPSVSVCMAAYNGERYIESQIRSILPQLVRGDEIVVVDDASTDGTRAILRRLQQELTDAPLAPEIRLIDQKQNTGVVATFERALRSAYGEILFLCDDDDLWAPQKVSRVLDAFAGRPEVKVVTTALTLIDEFNLPLKDQGFLKHRRFREGFIANLLHNQFQGSAMAIRASLLGDVLPFPRGQLFLHDAWIGMRNRLAGGRAVYLDEPLLQYRRHTGNYSRRLSRLDQVMLRLQLVWAHVLRCLPAG